MTELKIREESVVITCGNRFADPGWDKGEMEGSRLKGASDGSILLGNGVKLMHMGVNLLNLVFTNGS